MEDVSDEESPEPELDANELNEGEMTAVESSKDSSPKNKRKSWLFQKKKAIASKTATSSLGKALFKKFVDKETVLLLKTIKIMVTKEDGPKKAKEINNNILKLAVKILLLYEDKSLVPESFEGVTFLFQRICSTV